MLGDFFIFKLCVLVVFATLIALGFNQLRAAHALPLIAKVPYQTLVPCPVEASAKTVVAMVNAQEALRLASKSYWIDAREKADFKQWHQSGAQLLTYDFLAPLAPKAVSLLLSNVSRRHMTRVLVYGDGGNPDSGCELAKDLMAAGMRQVVCVQGGASALLQMVNP